MERLQKIIAHAGLASRREAEEWIQEGRVTVNGKVITQLGSHADPEKDKIKVDGKLIRQPARLYYMFHKPAGMITSMDDTQGRLHLGEWLERSGRRARLFPVGRLDFNSSGLLVLTNDGQLAQRLAHPSYKIRKSYRVKVSRSPSEQEVRRLRRGIKLEEGTTAPAKVTVVQRLKKNAWVQVEIHEGRYREVRRMFEALGIFVEKLVRVRVGPLSLGLLPPGEMRPLTASELKVLKKCVGM